MSSAEIVIVIAACPNDAEATRIAKALVEQKLAACVQRNPIVSTYAWQGKIYEGESEVRLLIKTTRTRFSEVEALFKANTEYSNPEIMAYPVVEGSADYIAWIEAETR